MRGKIYRWLNSEKCGWIRTTDDCPDIFVADHQLPAAFREPDLTKPGTGPVPRIGLIVEFDLMHGRYLRAENVKVCKGYFHPHAGSIRGAARSESHD